MTRNGLLGCDYATTVVDLTHIVYSSDGRRERSTDLLSSMADYAGMKGLREDDYLSIRNLLETEFTLTDCMTGWSETMLTSEDLSCG